jgi:hypothetical protein
MRSSKRAAGNLDDFLLGVPSTRLRTSRAQHAAPGQGSIAARFPGWRDALREKAQSRPKLKLHVGYFAGGIKAGSTKVSHGFRSGIMLSDASKRIISARPGPSTAASLRKALFSETMNL